MLPKYRPSPPPGPRKHPSTASASKSGPARSRPRSRNPRPLLKFPSRFRQSTLNCPSVFGKFTDRSSRREEAHRFSFRRPSLPKRCPPLRPRHRTPKPRGQQRCSPERASVLECGGGGEGGDTALAIAPERFCSSTLI